jgi:hypothetical protein
MGRRYPSIGEDVSAVTSPGNVTSADIPALLKTADDFQKGAEDLRVVGARLAGVPAPIAGAYGSQRASDAMAAFLGGWSAELTLTETAAYDMATSIRTVVDNLREADRLAAKRAGMHGL